MLCYPEIKHKREEVAEDLTESDLNKIVDIDLTETETIWLLDMPGVCVGADSDEAPLITEQNERYNEVRENINKNNMIIYLKTEDEKVVNNEYGVMQSPMNN